MYFLNPPPPGLNCSGNHKDKIKTTFLFCVWHISNIMIQTVFGFRRSEEEGKNSSPDLKAILSTLLHPPLTVKHFSIYLKTGFTASHTAHYENQIHRFSHSSGLDPYNFILCTKPLAKLRC